MQELDIWVERRTRYLTLIDRSIEPLRRVLVLEAFVGVYNEGCRKWTEEGILFPFNDPLAQAIFYETIDTICDSLETAEEGDWAVWVPSCYS